MPQHMADIDKIVLHHSASPRNTTKAEDIARWHRERGFLAIGYHFVIEGNGTVRHGRDIDSIPAAQKGANTGSIAICLVGDNTKPGEGWTDDQKLSARSLIIMLRTILPKPLRLCGHRDVAPSECPGIDVADVFPDLVSV